MKTENTEGCPRTRDELLTALRDTLNALNYCRTFVPSTDVLHGKITATRDAAQIVLREAGGNPE